MKHDQQTIASAGSALSADLLSPPRQTHELALDKRGHQFRLRYETGEESTVLEVLAEMVADPRTPFDWFDAATLGHQLGQHLAGEMTQQMAA